MKKNLVITLFLSLFYTAASNAGMATQHDSTPFSSTFYAFDFMNQKTKAYLKGESESNKRQIMRFSLTSFGQKATRAKDQNKVNVPAGDVRGRWNMLGLLYGDVPTGQTRAALLTSAAGQSYQDGQNLNHINYSDVNDNLGHFSIPLTYRKMGARFEWSFCVPGNITFSFEGGVADIKQTNTHFVNQGHTDVTIERQDVYGSSEPAGVDSTLTTDRATIATYLMDPHAQIFEQIGLNIKDFHKTGAEDAFITMAWFHNFDCNYEDEDTQYAPFILTPFFKITAMAGIGEKQNQLKAFSLPFGNNGHHGVSISTGFSLDFYESIEFSWQAGASHFFKRKIQNMFIPTSKHQTGIFPFKTDVEYNPGKTWFFKAGINAYHMNGNLSCYATYNFINHSKDTIQLITPDTAFKPEVLEDQTKWTTQSVNIGFNLDLSDYMTVGFVWQAPIGQRGAYKTNTLGFTAAGTF